MTWRSRVLQLSLVGSGLLLLVAQNDFREDVLECEQAVAHLIECCPNFVHASVQCVHDEGCGTRTDPALSLNESHCIENRSCEDVRDSGLCMRTQNLGSPTFDEEDGGFHLVDGGHAAVCE
jgi:hypothetical protein